ncbi:epoxyqueuosine reductase [Wukongibacter baidiensis]|uniref:epoxyqueuosine reductase n=1 Tax=Wukongibacter baidiensis TaxID=1723361 RepID=UPI003D7FD118
MSFKNKLLQKAINCLKNHPENRIDELIIFDDLLIGYSSSHDPLFEVLKDPSVVSPHYLSPRAWLSNAETIISFFFSFSEKIRKSNRSGRLPSSKWVNAHLEGEKFIDTFTRLMIKEFETMGENVIAPSQHPNFKIENLKSNWSERHTAYICGLGTFGLSESIITNLGSAGRLSSIITSLKESPTPRTYTGIYDHCLWHSQKKCGACMKKCPPQAILEDGTKNKSICYNHLSKAHGSFHPRYTCGKCQAGMVCENRKPVKKRQDVREHFLSERLNDIGDSALLCS